MIVSKVKALEAATVLGIPLDGLTNDALRAAYRTEAKKCHPDHHGASELQRWARVSWAKECLEFWLKNHPPTPKEAVDLVQKGDCRTCNGSGRVEVRKRNVFGPALTMACIYCRGTGSVEPEEIDID